jgi:pimeloyl-ACP methyl ester carboxylesterase
MNNRRDRRSALAVLLTAAALAAGVVHVAASSPPSPDNVTAAERGPGARECRADRFGRLDVPGAKITGVRAAFNPGGQVKLTPPAGSPVPDIDFCEVEISLTHGGEGTEGLPADDVHVWVWLPLEWNGRLQAVGGGGTRATNGPSAMVPALERGYAVTASDAGLSVQNPQTYIFLTNGTFNWQLFENWSYRSVHENAALAKAALKRFYGKDARYSYWNGCSNGGRQGLEMTQRYPDDFDGVLAAAPAIYGAERLNMTMSWPAFLQNDAFGGFIPRCKLTSMTQAVLAACDGGDGVVDGLVSDPGSCDYRTALAGEVGKALACGTITAEEVEVVAKIFDGPKDAAGRFVWYGHTPGVNLAGGAITFHDGWPIQTFLMHDPAYDWRTATTEDLIEVFGPMYRSRLSILEGADPVLEPYANHGGKILMWHGLADGLFPADQSVHYYEQVRQVSGESTQDYFRLFLAPGVDHCGGGAGPAPTDPLAALVRWVERGDAPKVLPAAQRNSAGEVVRERALCPYPRVQVYRGGDPNRASSFRCGDDFPDR